MTISDLYQTFAVAFLPGAIYMRLWKNSVSTFLLVVASAWCAMTSPAETSETLRFGGLLLIEIFAVGRAILKPAADKWVPHVSH